MIKKNQTLCLCLIFVLVSKHYHSWHRMAQTKQRTRYAVRKVPYCPDTDGKAKRQVVFKYVKVFKDVYLYITTFMGHDIQRTGAGTVQQHSDDNV